MPSASSRCWQQLGSRLTVGSLVRLPRLSGRSSAGCTEQARGRGEMAGRDSGWRSPRKLTWWSPLQSAGQHSVLVMDPGVSPPLRGCSAWSAAVSALHLRTPIAWTLIAHLILIHSSFAGSTAAFAGPSSPISSLFTAALQAPQQHLLCKAPASFSAGAVSAGLSPRWAGCKRLGCAACTTNRSRSVLDAFQGFASFLAWMRIIVA